MFQRVNVLEVFVSLSTFKINYQDKTGSLNLDDYRF